MPNRWYLAEAVKEQKREAGNDDREIMPNISGVSRGVAENSEDFKKPAGATKNYITMDLLVVAGLDSAYFPWTYGLSSILLEQYCRQSESSAPNIKQELLKCA